MRHLDLFSGIGGFALAARNVGWETIGFCESDAFCQEVLRKHWPDVPIYPDVRELDADAVGFADIVTGGYPCQPFSLAGKRRGAGDDRHLWPAFARLICELRPRWVVGENVAGHISMGLDDVLTDLERLGYAWEAFVIPACAVDAKHRRDRIWIVANRDGGSGELRREPGDVHALTANATPMQRRALERHEPHGDLRGNEVVADAQNMLSNGGHNNGQSGPESFSEFGDRSKSAGPNCCRWRPEPDVGRVAHGVPRRVDRLRSLGNAIVPQVAEEIFQAIVMCEGGQASG